MWSKSQLTFIDKRHIFKNVYEQVSPSKRQYQIKGCVYFGINLKLGSCQITEHENVIAKQFNVSSFHFICCSFLSAAGPKNDSVDGGLHWMHIFLCVKCISDEAADRWGKVAASEESAQLFGCVIGGGSDWLGRQSVRWRVMKEAIT